MRSYALKRDIDAADPVPDPLLTTLSKYGRLVVILSSGKLIAIEVEPHMSLIQLLVTPHVYVHMYIYIYTYIHTYAYNICIYIYIYIIHTDIHGSVSKHIRKYQNH